VKKVKAINLLSDLTITNMRTALANRSPYIMGFQKCGINSIIKWYANKYPDWVSTIHTTEDITSVNCLPTYEPFRDTHFPVVIIRNQVAAIWSIYWFFGYWRTHTLEEFLEIDQPSIQYGNENPINRTDYAYHISKFEGYEDIVVHQLEEIKDIPHLNKTEDMFTQNKEFGHRESNPHDRWIIAKAIDNYNRDNLEFKVKLV